MALRTKYIFLLSMDTSGLNVFSLSHSYKLQGFVSWIIKLGKIK